MSAENHRVDRAHPKFSRHCFFKDGAISAGSGWEGWTGLTQVSGDATNNFFFGELSDTPAWLIGDGAHSKIITGLKHLALNKAKQ